MPSITDQAGCCRFAAACALALFAVAGCVGSDDIEPDGDGDPTTTAGGSVVGGGEAEGGGPGSGGEGAGGEPSVPAVEDPFETPQPPAGLSEGQLDDIRAGIDAALAGASASYSVLVVGLDSGQVVYAKNADTARKPASNTKLFTTAATLVLEGEAGRPGAGLYATAVNGTVVQGDLVLFGEHDPVHTTWFGGYARQSLDAAAEALVARGITQVTGGVVARGEFLFEGNSLGTIDFASERSQTATALRQAIVGAGISVGGGATTSTSLDPPAGELLAALPSASADAIAHAINVPSHNEMADLMMHHLGRIGGGASTYAAGFDTTLSVLDDLGVAHAGLDLNDGSGLSHDNRTTPRHIVDMFTAISRTDVWPAYQASLAVSGVRGTIAGRMSGANTYGRFWGKTGTLTGVVALSGVLFHRHDGQRYAASLLANDVGNPTSARAALDGAVAAFAGNIKGGAGLPATPVLQRVIDDRNGETAQVTFSPAAGADRYLLERSADGRTWDLEEARLIDATTHRTFTFDGRLFVRVRAVNAAGAGAPSNVLAAQVGSGAGARALFVDGDQRYQSGPVPENPLAWGNDAVVAHAFAIDGPFESAFAGQVASGAVDLGGFDAVLWGFGRESVTDETFSSAEQAVVRAYVEGGGRLFVSGAEVAYDLLDQGTAEDSAFAREVLGIEYVSDDAATNFVIAADVPVELGLVRFSKLGRHEVAYADVISPATTGTSCLRYAAGELGDACVLSDTARGGRVIALGFPLEALDDPAAGKALVALLGP